MRRFLIRPAGFCLCAAMAVYCTSLIAQQTGHSAHADIVNAQGQKIGTATILPSSSGVRINVEVSQLPPGAHGIHIHTAGKARISIRLRRNTERTVPRDHMLETC